jgi:hypothetical protein
LLQRDAGDDETDLEGLANKLLNPTIAKCKNEEVSQTNC